MRSERRKDSFLDQLEMQLEDVEADAIESELEAQAYGDLDRRSRCFEQQPAGAQAVPQSIYRGSGS